MARSPGLANQHISSEKSLEMDREPKSYLWDCGRGPLFLLGLLS